NWPPGGPGSRGKMPERLKPLQPPFTVEGYLKKELLASSALGGMGLVGGLCLLDGNRVWFPQSLHGSGLNHAPRPICATAWNCGREGPAGQKIKAASAIQGNDKAQDQKAGCVN